MDLLKKLTITNGDITIRSLTSSDSEVLFLLINKNRKYLQEWLNWLDRKNTIQETKIFIQTSEKNSETGIGSNFGIFIQGKLAGVISYKELDIHNRKVTIGYWLDHNYQGKGIMTKSVKMLIDYAFNKLKLHRIQITCAIGNDKSAAIPKRLKFCQEGILKDTEWLYDHFVDHEVYSLINNAKYSPQ
jgi:ribosomal-protein-serine acetyltransferase